MTVQTQLSVTSSAFAEGDIIPAQYTCDGDNLAPPLAWDRVPEGTRSFALLVEDPDAGNFAHWVLTDIPADLRELPEGQGDQMGTPGGNSFGGQGWTGPCPPSGEHRYVFTLFALSDTLQLPGSVLTADVRSAMEGKILGQGQLTGVYARS